MQIRTLSFPKYHRKYQTKEVTSFKLEGIGTLFDPNIFGYGEEKKSRCGYIDLGGPYVDPPTFDIARRLFRDLPYIIDGTKFFKIEEDGSLTPSTEEEGGKTGLKWFYDNYNRIQLKKLQETEGNKIQTRKMKEAFTKLKREEFFFKQLLVIPLHYRDIDTTSGTSIKVDELNQLYIDLLKATNFKKRLGESAMNTTFVDVKIQGIIMQIYEYMKNVQFGKEGAQRQLAMGRSVDNCSRIIITAPEVKRSDVIGKCRHNLDQAIIPLHHIMNMHPVHTVTATMKILKSFKEQGLMGNIDDDEFEAFYTDEWLTHAIESYTMTFSHRLDKVPTPNGEDIILTFKFKDEDTDEEDHSTRGITYIELFFLAVMLFIDKVRVASIRYPIIGKGSMIYLKMNIGSFNKNIGHMDIYLPSDEEFPVYSYDHFPNIMSIENGVISSTTFEETMKFNNLYLGPLDGDYDGDKTSQKPVYSEEGVAEIDNYNDSPLAWLGLDGKPSMKLTNESMQGLYNLTKIGKNPKPNDDKLNNYLKVFFEKEDYTLGEILDLVSEYGHDHYVRWKGFNKTTLGRVVYNEVVFNHIPSHQFIDKTVDSKTSYNVTAICADKMVNKEITVEDYKNVLNKMDQLAFGICSLTGSNLTYNMLLKDDDTYNKKLEEVRAKYQDRLDKDDIEAQSLLEEEMIKFSKEYYKDDPMADMLDSGAKTSWGNQYKNLKIGVGNAPGIGGEVRVIQSNLKEGLNTAEIEANANMQLFGAAGRAIETQDGGERVKMFVAALQSTYAHSGDCGTTATQYIKIESAENIIGRYIMENGKEILVSREMADKYVGKDVLMRTPMTCKSKNGYCKKCLGEYVFNLTDTQNFRIGFYVADIGSKLLGADMKATHNMGVKVTKIQDLDDFII